LQHLGSAGLTHSKRFGRTTQGASTGHQIKESQVSQSQPVYSAVEDLIDALRARWVRWGRLGYWHINS
jgi:hypothetical protein